MAEGSPSLIPFLGAMTTGQDNRSPQSPQSPLSQLSSQSPPDEGPMAPYPQIQDMETPDLYPPQSYYNRPPTRSVHLDFTGWAQRQIQVTEGDPSGAAIYNITFSSREPQMKVFPLGAPTTPIATAVLPLSGSVIQLSFYGRNITMGVRTRLKKEGSYNSPSMENAPLMWKSRSMKMVDFELRDANGIPLAQFNPHPSWSRRKAGRLDLFGPSVSTGQLMEEIMVTAFVLVHSANLLLEGVAEGA
ncbi:hypothetical protein BJY04DRAFT_199980 [Aspergillus karnatakaensis]|uniref:uncharacterized protein n=1 Tax=Aspergillus karnatakaensis TaxID=1810916 RepID=UPI003CCCA5E8